MIALLTKSDASEGFDQIVDFLNAHTIQYAFMVNLPIYVSCIKHFWALVLVKKTHDVVKLQVLINKKKNEDDDKVSAAPTPPSPTLATTLTSPIHEPSPPPQEPISSTPQAPAPPSTPPQEQPTQPTNTFESSMTLLNTLMENRVKKLEMKRRSTHSGLKRLRKVGTSQRVESSNDTVVGAQEDASKQGENSRVDVDDDVTLVDLDTVVKIDADIQERIEEDIIAVKEINVAEPEPTVFNDEEVTMTMAQTLIKMKAKKARILDEQLAKRLQHKEIEQATAREKQEQGDLERAKVLQQQYDQKQENIDWNVVAEHIQE
nr:hypothetical protein [Tanacetum cinerariifolium]